MARQVAVSQRQETTLTGMGSCMMLRGDMTQTCENDESHDLIENRVRQTYLARRSADSTSLAIHQQGHAVGVET